MSLPSTVFTPLQVGDLTLAHRIALAPATRLRVHSDDTISDLAVEYYAQRASFPGTLLVTEATGVHAGAGALAYVNFPLIQTPKHIDAWRKVVDAVHAQGSYLFLQIALLGRAGARAATQARNPDWDLVGPSDVPMPGGDVPRPMTEAEIKQQIQWMADAAKAFVEEAGGDGVEIHGANGYLVDQFFQTVSNTRTDQYGGSAENRSRFALEVADAVVAAVGPKKVGFRLSPYADSQGMKMAQADIEETFTYFVRELKLRHPDLAYLHLVTARVAAIEDREAAPAESLDFLAREWAPKPLLVAGGHGLDAEAPAKTYENSVVVYGRYFTSNPDLVARVKHQIPFRPYDRSTFYVPGPDKAEGYTTYPVEYGADGEL